MSDFDKERKAKRPPQEAAAGDDPWAKWRQPESVPTPTPAPKPRPAPAQREDAPRSAVKVEVKAEKPAATERPTGTLSPIKAAKPARPAAKRPSAAAGAPRPHPQSRGGKAHDVRPPREERPPVPQRPPRDPADISEGVRLSKVMSERAMCSRREADLWIERGWVFVNGERISELGSRISPDAEIVISKEAKLDQAKQVTILLNKPIGYVSGQPEADCKPAVTLISAESWVRQSGDPEFKPWMLRGLAPAGRLDIDSTGLLVFTQDGRIAKKLIGEDSQVEKEYLVRVSGEMVPGGLKLLQHGLELDGKPLKPAWVKQLNEDQLHFILKEGKKRQIRRMCELVGLRVIGLKRVRIGRVKLGDLQIGQWRFLRPDESF
ncbi:pseudouridine synthase [Dechloromonas sp. A34]|uniref:pseudouridine synthase n=1 Tax=Dechloromonas sp. A34 TaxID=447588 RepID=UPI002248A4A2|nr:pseudouridine synthase [Dechloromonas sp. A34]